MDPQTRPPQRRPLRLAFHASRIVIDLGVLIVMGAMSLPFITAEAGNRSAVSADALPALLLVLPIFAITLIPDHSRPLPPPLGWVSLALAVAALPFAVVKYLDAGTVADTVGGSVGTGARLLVFGTLVVVAGIVIGLARSIMGLPAGGTYPARREQTSDRPRRQHTGRNSRSPAARRAGSGAGAASDRGTQPAREGDRRRVAAPDRGPDPARTPPAPTPADPAATRQIPRRPASAADEPAAHPGIGGSAPGDETPSRPGTGGEAQARVAPPRARKPVIRSRSDDDPLPRPRPSASPPSARRPEGEPRRDSDDGA